MGVSRKTNSVKAVLRIFEDTSNALSVKELVGKLNGEMNKVTVYRILQRLEDDGMMHSFIGKDGLRWFARCKECAPSGHSDAHPHFQCRVCGKTECLNFEIYFPEIPNYQVDKAEILLIGQCEDCLS